METHDLYVNNDDIRFQNGKNVEIETFLDVTDNFNGTFPHGDDVL